MCERERVSRRPAGDRPVRSFRPGWWSSGLALHERPPLRLCRTSSTADAWRQLDLWREASRLDTEFAERLAGAGHDAASAAYLMSESRRELAERVPMPDWALAVEQALDDHRDPPSRGSGSWQAAFAQILYPFVAHGRALLLSRLHPDAAEQVEVEAIVEGFCTLLGHQLAGLAARTLVTRLDRRRRQGLLAGEDGARRFEDFIRSHTDPEVLAELLQEYPVLARLLAQATRNAADAHLELIERLLADRAAIIANLLDGIDPGPIGDIQARRGDTHMRGRSVAIVTFVDGRRVVYKPRDLTAQQNFGELVEWLNGALKEQDYDLDLLAARVLPRQGYGWTQFIPQRDLGGPAGADRFYLRLGALLAMLHVLRAADVNCENMIACGDQPVLIDAEALFHPSMDPSQIADPALRTLNASVYRTALLPRMIVGDTGVLDMSGVGGDRNKPIPSAASVWEDAATDRMRLVRKAVRYAGALNRPCLGEREFDPIDHEAALIDGFRLAYEAIEQRRDELAAMIGRCSGVETRVVIRPTRIYASLLEESTHPDALRDGLLRDRLFDRLWQLPAGDALRRAIAPHEIGQLWEGDIPIFFSQPDSRNLLTPDGTRIPGVMRDTGLGGATEKIAAMGEADRQDQEWIISATLATRRAAPSHFTTPSIAGPFTATVADPDLLLAAACGLADRIVARGLGDRSRVNWLGLEFVDERQWLVLPMGAGFANGYLGVSVFLAQLAALTGISRYDAVARRAVSPIPELFDNLTRLPIAVTAIGCGGMNGFGGIAYALARLSTLLDDDRIRANAGLAIELAGRACEDPCPPGVADGLAGCLAAMLAVHSETGLPAAAKLATSCAERLATIVERTDGRCEDTHYPRDDRADDRARAGFAEGCAGVGWALTRFAREARLPSFADAGAQAIAQTARLQAFARTARSQDPNHGWCSGTSGLAAARADADSQRAMAILTKRPVLRDLSLCHGEMGIVEALTVLAHNGDRDFALARDRHAGLVLDAIGRHGPLCGTPGQTITPGFQYGLAGIGYGLLRAAFSDRVPSALLLEPTPAQIRQ